MSKPITALVPSTVAEAQQLSKTYAKSHLLPKELQGKEADIFVTIMAGQELGLAPMASLRSIHVVQGKPVISADGLVAVALAHPQCEYFHSVTSSDTEATYETKRKGSPPTRRSFTSEDAKRAGLLGKDTWKKYPAAMLRARCKADLARDVYPDAVSGVYTPDEAQDIDPRAARAIDVEPASAAPEPAEQAPDETLGADDLAAAMRDCDTERQLERYQIDCAALEGDELEDIRAVYGEVRTTLRSAVVAALKACDWYYGRADGQAYHRGEATYKVMVAALRGCPEQVGKALFDEHAPEGKTWPL